MTLILVSLAVLCFVLRMNLLSVLLVVSALLHLTVGDGDLIYLVEDFWSALDREVLMSIPLFLLCGTVMSRGQIAPRLVAILRELTNPLPGGLAAAAIMSCAVFAAISGSSTVTMLAIGAVMYPSLIKYGYDQRYAIGAIASAGTLGVLIPPSIPMIVYGIVTETPITKMFLAGILPGLLLTLVLVTHAIIRNRKIERQPFELAGLIRALREGVLSLLMPVILLGGIYSGFFTATESAAIAVAYAIIVEVLIHKDVGLKDLHDIIVETVVLLGSLFPIIAIATSLNLMLTAAQIPADFTDWFISIVKSKWTFLIALNILLLILGFLMDMISALVIVAPLILPVARAYGIDPVHLGIIMIINLEIGFLTPPMGLNVIVAAQTFKARFLDVCRYVLPFIGMMICVLIVISVFPQISLWLVN